MLFLGIYKPQISLAPLLGIFRPDDWLCYLEGYFEGSEAFSDLDKKAQHDWLAMLAMGKGKTWTTVRTFLVMPFFILLYPSFVLCPFSVFTMAHSKFKLWSEIILHTKIHLFNNSFPLPLLHFACLNRVDLISGNLNPPICLRQVQNTCLLKPKHPSLALTVAKSLSLLPLNQVSFYLVQNSLQTSNPSYYSFN